MPQASDEDRAWAREKFGSIDTYPQHGPADDIGELVRKLESLRMSRRLSETH